MKLFADLTWGCRSMSLYFLGVGWPPAGNFSCYEINNLILIYDEKAYVTPGEVTDVGMSSVCHWPLALVTQMQLVANMKIQMCPPPLTFDDRLLGA